MSTSPAAKPDKAAQTQVSFYNDPLLSDVTIQFGEHKIFAHKCILSKKSKYFYTAFTGKFIEAEANVIDLGTDEEPRCVRSLIKHLYDEPYDDCFYRPSAFPHELLFHARLFATADKYDVPSLRDLVVARCRKMLAVLQWYQYDMVDTILAVQAICDHVGDRALQNEIYWFFQIKIDDVLQQPSFSMLVARCGELAVQLLDWLGKDKHDAALMALMSREAFRELIIADPMLGKELLHAHLTGSP